MPACYRCRRVQATAEVRRTTKGHVCKDKYVCEARRNRDSGGALRIGTLAAALVALAVLVPPSFGHILPHRKHMTLAKRQAFQLRVLHHDRSVVRFWHRHVTVLRSDAAAQRSLQWHRAQARWTKRELAETVSALDLLLIPHRPAWLCIHSYEGDWEDGEWPFIGGLQFDYSFAHTYGEDMIRRYGEPRFTHAAANGWTNAWSPREQMIVAERAHRTRGFYPWPKTARYCGLI